MSPVRYEGLPAWRIIGRVLDLAYGNKGIAIVLITILSPSPTSYQTPLQNTPPLQEIIAWYRMSTTPDSQDRGVQEVKVLLTQTQYESQNHGDRAALIVTDHVSGAALFNGIIEDTWYFYHDTETRDPARSTRLECSLAILDARAESHDGHYFEFNNCADYVRFRDFLLDGQELSKGFQQAWRDALITGVLRGEGHSVAL
ncbi:hypothetical protein OH76DRAFT_1490808 [Lentinus brumalis]|uniref:Uncharacterized protein n=1 Tax=Lentinus brumalis TaxID=2498619 RepID=A0A371CHS4_9APHY|nr:hypothetical protein OH76DRAFT_1490808 [Polyporus brumalis]